MNSVQSKSLLVKIVWAIKCEIVYTYQNIELAQFHKIKLLKNLQNAAIIKSDNAINNTITNA